MKDIPRVDILLATYNGSAFLESQLHSLVQQTYPNWHLLARDDGSTDQTLAILEAFARQHPGQVTLITGSPGNLGIRGNFDQLLKASRAPYALFCDQDDIWLPHKIEVELQALHQLEARWGSEMPLLVYSDLAIIDRHDRIIAPSFWKYQGLDGHANRLNHLVVQNVMTGCTMMFNASLREMALPLPLVHTLHDAWLGLVASCFGRVLPVDQALVRYRQHGSNAVGAYAYSGRRLLSKVVRWKEVRWLERGLEAQAGLFLSVYGDRLSASQRQVLECMLDLSRRPFPVRKFLVLRHRLFKSGLLRNLAWILRA